MFDIVRWSGKEYRTYDLYCSLCEFWINPKGELFEIDYNGTHDFVGGSYADGWETYPNGNHGKVKPVILNVNITLYNDSEELTLHLFNGKIRYLS